MADLISETFGAFLVEKWKILISIIFTLCSVYTLYHFGPLHSIISWIQYFIYVFYYILGYFNHPYIVSNIYKQIVKLSPKKILKYITVFPYLKKTRNIYVFFFVKLFIRSGVWFQAMYLLYYSFGRRRQGSFSKNYQFLFG